MKQLIAIFAVGIILLIIGWIGILFLRVPICKGKILKSARPFIQFFSPPKDLYERVVNEQIDISKAGSVQIVKFKIKYIGPYAILVWLDNLSEELSGKPYDLKLQMRFDFYKGDVLLASKNTADYYNKSWGFRWGGRCVECEFESPAEIPIDTEITCKLTVLSIDDYLREHCSGVRLLIHKYSEE